MKAISLWQPWASLVVIGSKQIETRGWSTNYRGPLLIHAAKRKHIGELIYFGSCWAFDAALQPLGGTMTPNTSIDLVKDLPFGAIIGQVELVDCRPTDSFTIGEIETRRYPDEKCSDWKSYTEKVLGDFTPGRFGWVFKNPVRFETPIPYSGKQGFFEVAESVVMVKDRHMAVKS